MNTEEPRSKSLLEYFRLCITKKYFCFKGRARRKEFWSFILFNLLINIAVAFYYSKIAASGGDTSNIQILYAFIKLALFIPGYAVLVRRLHDVNFSGWWAILPFLGMLIAGIMSGYINSMQQIASAAEDMSVAMIIAVIIGFISGIASLVVVVVTPFFKSNMKENKYGPIPEGVE